jgi:hypothetical protein
MSGDMEQFYTREKANEGIKLPLTCVNGEATDHYLVIRGRDSDLFRDAESEAKRALINSGGEDVNSIAKEGVKTVIASLVSGWSFDKECNLNNVKQFLESAPQISDEIDRVAGDRALFFALKSQDSKSTRKKKSTYGGK